MKAQTWSSLKRSYTVIKLFVDIFWSFYTLRFKRLFHRASWLQEKRQELYVTQARHFRHTAVDLGGLLIKLGQFLSTRVDMLPQVSIRELTGLQDEVEEVDIEAIRFQVEQEFGRTLEDVFSFFDPRPIASASLGQVHEGRLVDGQRVAIKVMRPGIERLVDIDLQSLQKVVFLIKLFTDWNRFIDLDAIYQEFADTLWAELNYVQEGHNAETITANSQDDMDFMAPAIRWEYTTQRVLTMTYMDGIKITDYENLVRAGLDRKKIAARLLEIYVRQILVDGFYHADPHPGNLFVEDSGKIIMVDFGMVGSISPEMRLILIDLVLAMVRRDYTEVVEYLKKLGFLRLDADAVLVTRAVGIFLEHLLGGMKELSSFDLQSFLHDLERLLYEQPFQIPARFTFLGRALGTLYGICVGLDPDINFLDVSKPYVDRFLGSQDSRFTIGIEKVKSLGTSLIELPPMLERVLVKTEQGDLRIQAESRELKEALELNARAIHALTWAVVAGFLLLASSFMLSTSYQGLARTGFLFSGLAFVFMLRSRSKPKMRRAPHPPVMMRKNR